MQCIAFLMILHRFCSHLAAFDFMSSLSKFIFHSFKIDQVRANHRALLLWSIKPALPSTLLFSYWKNWWKNLLYGKNHTLCFKKNYEKSGHGQSFIKTRQRLTKTGQRLAKDWQKTGQRLAKDWPKTAQNLFDQTMPEFKVYQTDTTD